MKNQFATMHEADNQTLARYINRYGLPSIMKACAGANGEAMQNASNRAQQIREARENAISNRKAI